MFLKVIGFRLHSGQHDRKKLSGMLAKRGTLLLIPFERLTWARNRSVLDSKLSKVLRTYLCIDDYVLGEGENGWRREGEVVGEGGQDVETDSEPLQSVLSQRRSRHGSLGTRRPR